MMVDLLTAGTWATFDKFMQVEKLPKKGETINIKGTVEDIETVYYGGCAYNIAMAAAKLGTKLGVLTVEGKNFATSGYVEYLEENGVDLSSVIVLEDDYSGHGYLMTDEEGNSIVIGALGSAYRQKEHEPDEHAIQNARALVVAPTFDEFTLKACQLAKKNNVLAAVSGSLTTWPEITESFIKTIDILFNNHFEVASLIEFLKLEKIEDLFDMGLKSIFMTMGSKGCRIITPNFDNLIPSAMSKGRVEPTGAGDAFVGGTMTGILMGYDYETAARIGNTLGSFVIEKRGAQTNLPTWEQMKERYETSYDLELEPMYIATCR
jgi:sugar/nucleoside kinase (ribokinase family)